MILWNSNVYYYYSDYFKLWSWTEKAKLSWVFQLFRELVIIFYSKKLINEQCNSIEDELNGKMLLERTSYLTFFVQFDLFLGICLQVYIGLLLILTVLVSTIIALHWVEEMSTFTEDSAQFKGILLNFINLKWNTSIAIRTRWTSSQLTLIRYTVRYRYVL